MKALPNLFSANLVEALGYTLLHSLWQGALVAVALSALLMLMRKSSSQARYAASAGAMVFLLAAVCATFAWQYNVPVQAATAKNSAVSAQWPQNWPQQAATVTEGPVIEQVYSSVAGFFQQHLPLLVLAWALGAMCMLLRMMGGLVLVQRMRHHKLVAAAVGWQERLNLLRNTAGIKRAVVLAESAMVKIPLTIGVLKPIILLPIGTLAGLPANQVEAILAHELAHIGRKDFLFNLLQSFVEVLFFFHPAMWYISNCIRTEREHCCDDFAISVCGDSVTFARALASIEEFAVQPPALAMALGKKKGSLLNRVKRLLGQPEDSASFGEGFWSGCVLAALFLVATIGLLLSKPATEATAAIPGYAQASWLPGGQLISDNSVQDITVANVLTEANNTSGLLASALSVTDTATGKTNDLIIIKNKKGKIVELYVNGHKVPRKNIPDYTAQIDQALDNKRNSRRAGALSRDEERKQITKVLAKADHKKKGMSYHIASGEEEFDFDFDFDFNFDGLTHVKVSPMPPMPPMPPMAPGDSDDDQTSRQYEQAMKEYEKEMAVYEKEMEQYELEMEKFEEEMEKLGPAIERQVQVSIERSGIGATDSGVHRQRAAMARKRAASAGSSYRQGMEQHRIAMRQHSRDMEQHARDMAAHKTDMDVLATIKAELLKDGLMSEKDKKVNLSVTNEGMELNGEKQPEHVFRKYEKLIREKTGKKAGDKFNYQYQFQDKK